jgi:hypothetical protein
MYLREIRGMLRKAHKHARLLQAPSPVDNSVHSCSSIVYLNMCGIGSYMSVLNDSIKIYKEKKRIKQNGYRWNV